MAKLNIDFAQLNSSSPTFTFQSFFMSPAAALFQKALIETIRSARSQKKVIELIDNTVEPLYAEGVDVYVGFVRAVRAELSIIDPIDVADPEEWNLIQFSRVYLHRIMAHKPLAKQ
ncbi:MAG: hypothetical protein ACK420_00090 [Sphingomonadales bacterium]